MSHADPEPLIRALEVIAAAPDSAAALTLYALVSTLEHERTGCLFRLLKLRDLDADQRVIAYGLMECLARGEVGTPAWQAAKARMDGLIRGMAP
jgi:hypothetical protein